MSRRVPQQVTPPTYPHQYIHCSHYHVSLLCRIFSTSDSCFHFCLTLAIYPWKLPNSFKRNPKNSFQNPCFLSSSIYVFLIFHMYDPKLKCILIPLFFTQIRSFFVSLLYLNIFIFLVLRRLYATCSTPGSNYFFSIKFSSFKSNSLIIQFVINVVEVISFVLDVIGCHCDLTVFQRQPSLPERLWVLKKKCM